MGSAGGGQDGETCRHYQSDTAAAVAELSIRVPGYDSLPGEFTPHWGDYEPKPLTVLLGRKRGGGGGGGVPGEAPAGTELIDESDPRFLAVRAVLTKVRRFHPP